MRLTKSIGKALLLCAGVWLSLPVLATPNPISTFELSENAPASCSVELEEIRCYSSKSTHCYTANATTGGRSYTYEVSIVAYDSWNGQPTYWISYIDKSTGKAYQLNSDTFSTEGKALSNWVKKVIGDCGYSFK